MLAQLKNKIKEALTPALSTLREIVLGKNSERLDFLFDSFYKLESKQRTTVIAGASAALIAFFALILSLYFSQINKLEETLSNHTSYLNEVNKLLMKKRVSDSEFSSLENQVQRQLQGFSLKPFLEKASRESQIKLTYLNVRKSSNPEEIGKLSSTVKEQHVELRVQKVSLVRLLKFIELLEKPKKYIKVSAMNISSDDKLYFNLELSLRAFQAA